MHLFTFHLYCLAIKCWSNYWRLELFSLKMPMHVPVWCSIVPFNLYCPNGTPMPSSANKGYGLYCGLLGYDMDYDTTQSGCYQCIMTNGTSIFSVFKQDIPQKHWCPLTRLYGVITLKTTCGSLLLWRPKFYSIIVITQLNLYVLCTSSQKCFLILTLYHKWWH